MFLFGNDRKNPVYGALFDVGSGTVGIAVCEFDRTKKLPHIVFARRFEMRFSSKSTRKETVLRKVRETILSSSLVLQQEGLKALKKYKKHAKISNLFVTCSSPWSYNLARTVEYRDDDDFKISQSIIDDLVSSAETAILEDLKNKDSSNAENYDVIEKTSVDISVNDYTVADPIDLKGSSISLSHIIGLVPNEVSESINEVKDKLFPGAKLRIHTYMLIMYCIVRDVFPRLSTMTIVDVTGEAIEFGLVENGVLTENNAFEYGTANIIREAAELTSKPVPDIITLLRGYTDDDIESKSVKPVVEKCINYYADAIKETMRDKVIANDIILTTHRTFEPLYSYILEESFSKVTGRRRNILTIDPKLVEEISSGSDGDVYLAFEARFFHKLHGCGEFESK
jgi:hypothetical protein